MLVVTRRADEAVCLPSLGVRVRILKVNGNSVRIGIEAPPEIKIVRDELAFETVDIHPAEGRGSSIPANPMNESSRSAAVESLRSGS